MFGSCRWWACTAVHVSAVPDTATESTEAIPWKGMPPCCKPAMGQSRTLGVRGEKCSQQMAGGDPWGKQQQPAELEHNLKIRIVSWGRTKGHLVASSRPLHGDRWHYHRPPSRASASYGHVGSSGEGSRFHLWLVRSPQTGTRRDCGRGCEVHGSRVHVGTSKRSMRIWHPRNPGWWWQTCICRA